MKPLLMQCQQACGLRRSASRHATYNSLTFLEMQRTPFAQANNMQVMHSKAPKRSAESGKSIVALESTSKWDA